MRLDARVVVLAWVPKDVLERIRRTSPLLDVLTEPCSGDHCPREIAQETATRLYGEAVQHLEENMI